MGNNYFSNETILAVWQKGRITEGNDPSKFRKDEAGAWMSFSAYGDTNSVYGWEIDHIFPVSRGGSDMINNLQPLQWENNRAKADDYPTYNAAVTSQGNTNVRYSNIR